MATAVIFDVDATPVDSNDRHARWLAFAGGVPRAVVP